MDIHRVTATVLAQTSGSEPKPPEHPLGNPLFFMFVIVVLFLVFSLRSSKREQDEKQRLLDSLKKNDRVLTTSGIYGTVVNLKDDEVTLRVDDQAKVKIRFLKSAIARVLGGDEASSATTPAAQPEGASEPPAPSAEPEAKKS